MIPLLCDRRGFFLTVTTLRRPSVSIWLGLPSLQSISRHHLLPVSRAYELQRLRKRVNEIRLGIGRSGIIESCDEGYIAWYIRLTRQLRET